MRPSEDQRCEVCGLEQPSPLIDGRVRLTEHWPEGHFVFMCVACYHLYGLGHDFDNAVIYVKQFNKYQEVINLEIHMDTKEIRKVINHFRANEVPTEEWKVILIGEVAFQLALMNQQLKFNNDLLKVTVDYLVKKTVEDEVPEEEQEINILMDNVHRGEKLT